MEYLEEAIRNNIHGELLILVPVLYCVGAGLKKVSFVPDKYIPVLLAVCGVVMSLLYGLAVTPLPDRRSGLLLLFTSVTQGVLVSAASVFCNQISKQMKKKD